jgi:hypothetical protein
LQPKRNVTENLFFRTRGRNIELLNPMTGTHLKYRRN